MTEKTERLIESLRHELEHYGEMLALLDQQQDQVVRRAADEIINTVAAIQNRGEDIQAARRRREDCHRELAADLQLAPDATLADLAAALPAQFRPLLRALIEENNQLLFRVRDRARQNHILLGHSVELMQQFIHTLTARPQTPVYNGAGAVAPAAPGGSALLEAVG